MLMFSLCFTVAAAFFFVHFLPAGHTVAGDVFFNGIHTAINTSWEVVSSSHYSHWATATTAAHPASFTLDLNVQDMLTLVQNTLENLQ
jgi:hypothetical protein